ncbi:MAG: DNA-protecting protein DprA [Saprospiraceae bacterium]|nr:DNA-protecting protein DprA [Saprospiraceae bacterium]
MTPGMPDEQLLYQVALTKVAHVGPVTARTLLRQVESPKQLFVSSAGGLRRLHRLSARIRTALSNPEALRAAEAELRFAEANGIRVLWVEHEEYPWRLRQHEDSPLVIYCKGNAKMNPERAIAVVGTRNITEHGRALTEILVAGLAGQNIQVVSGLAYGVDACAHGMCLQHGIETIGVLGHGLDRMYPQEHRTLARNMLNCGGLVTEFGMDTRPDRENFPMRNRIIAGMCDALVVVETGVKGGSIITAEIANSYNRDVFAFPGRVSDPYARGCNKLIRENSAQLIESAEDLLASMNWDLPVRSRPLANPVLFDELNPEEKLICEALRKHGELHIDQFHEFVGIGPGKLAATLTSLEFRGLVRSHPGKKYTFAH